MNRLTELRSKFAAEITLYGITSVTVSGGRVYYESNERIPYELFNSIECFLL